MLLEFSHDIFEEQSSLTNAIQKILNKALEMFNCKRASLMLLDDPKDIEEVCNAKAFKLKTIYYLHISILPPHPKSLTRNRDSRYAKAKYLSVFFLGFSFHVLCGLIHMRQ